MKPDKEEWEKFNRVLELYFKNRFREEVMEEFQRVLEEVSKMDTN